MKSLCIGLFSVLLGVVLILLVSGPERTPDRPGEDARIAPPGPAPRELPRNLPLPVDTGGKPLTVLPISHTTSELNSLETSANEDILIIEALLDQYRRHYGGNPIGDNDDIVASLRGRNSKALAYLPAEHPALDARGQLLDRWGTPYHFHALSGKHMEIRSAGPDRELWSSDDLVHNHGE